MVKSCKSCPNWVLGEIRQNLAQKIKVRVFCIPKHKWINGAEANKCKQYGTLAKKEAVNNAERTKETKSQTVSK